MKSVIIHKRDLELRESGEQPAFMGCSFDGSYSAVQMAEWSQKLQHFLQIKMQNMGDFPASCDSVLCKSVSALAAEMHKQY